ncbi:endoglucanase [Dyella jiangningensis]|uniref:cellulose synthase complex periplasmic endoglucanase BcsZ n=2 Tax=Gammaproteobacteria TaxID=1236 RepID=UPI000885F54A|nr:cellulose synthase complex periplasmic endoglucanase BcsZ [Dyella sp. AtDHG13]PXV60727.1 endoglucanase [Dyella sp. AtDHG13]SDL00291.1 endoglucanase [Dyella jiangningensis]
MRRIGMPLLHALLLAAAMFASGSAMAASCAWPDWEHFKQNTVSADGRVIDASTPEQATVSEGQSYALFFALIANDRATFDRLLNWTQNNLAQGDLTKHLPAWQWGRHETKAGDKATWGVLDSNAASDADIWIAYTLLEAGRLWHERSYTALGTVLARTIVAQETAVVPGLGRTVLPGPMGFHPHDDVWRLNPSYVPPQVMRRMASALPEQPEWKAMLDSSARLVTDTAPHGYSPDWVLYQRGKGFGPDPATKAESAYNAIRVYLWVGMLATDAPARSSMLDVFKPLADYVAAHGAPPERVDTQSGAVIGSNQGNAGFSTAVAPYLDALGRHDLAQAQVQRARTLAGQSPLGYYSQVLTLFGLGYLDGLYRFDADGAVVPAWMSTCPARH